MPSVSPSGRWAAACPAGRRLLAVALIAGALVNAALAWAESATDLGKVWAGFGLTEGRPFAFMANPVHLAALCAAALWLVLSREAGHREPTPWLLAVALLVGATNLAGSRIALVLAALMVIGFAILLTRRRWWVHAAVLVLAGTVGFGLSLLPGESGQAGNSRVVGAPDERYRQPHRDLGACGAGDGRPAVPRVGPGPQLSGDHPAPLGPGGAIGGPGDHLPRHAQLPRGSPGRNRVPRVPGLRRLARHRGSQGQGSAGRVRGGGSRGPHGPARTVVVRARSSRSLLGAASADGDDAVGLSRGLWSSRSLRIASAITVVVGLGAGVWLLAADSDYYRATSGRRLAPLDSWASRHTPWPEAQSLTAKLWDAQAAVQPTSDAGRRALRAERVARDRDPYDPRAWVAVRSAPTEVGVPRRGAPRVRSPRSS